MRIRLVAALTAALIAAPAAAQMSVMPAELQATMDRIGPVWGTDILGNVAISERAYTPLLAAAPRDGVEVRRDVAYGPDPKQVLDIHARPGLTRAPVVVFFHGGAYVRGDKRVNDEIYGNVATWFARQGMVGINATYRLAPASPWPGGAQDVGAVVAWARENAARLGGDPDRILLIGHSAGATHVANYAFDRSIHPAAGPGVAGVVLMSGRYRLEYVANDPNARNMQAYFGADAAQYPARSAITHVGGSRLPVFIVVAEYDNPGLDVSGAELFSAICARDGACPRFARLERHNHLSMVHHFNTADEALGREILAFLQRGR
ncbi:alpha/beta hydrolase [Falsiroseomonas sp. CW058]|uniref:alpha/beta hydrolase n=1 Tax=Falsiroseomonas sp. CW058 TaxID=3388664 RepID=UPI003D310F23